MKTIFKNIEGRDWDYSKFNWNVKGNHATNEVGMNWHLSRFLSDKSWCKAVWGEGFGHGEHERLMCELKQIFYKNPITFFSPNAFQILQSAGEKKCLDYIHSTMLS